jgi:hypothetical protein
MSCIPRKILEGRVTCGEEGRQQLAGFDSRSFPEEEKDNKFYIAVPNTDQPHLGNQIGKEAPLQIWRRQ